MPHPSITPGLRRSTSHRTRGRFRAVAAGLIGLLALGAAGCDSAAEPTTIAQGGTLRVVVQHMPSHLDPQKIAEAVDANISRLLSRTLTTYKSEPGAASSELVSDLATDLGRPSEGNKVWQFTLRDGVKWEDGTLVNCLQLKYGVERNFSTLFSSGLPYARLYLVDNPTPYTGPFSGGNNGGAGLQSVTCIDSRTIKFELKQPVGDFNYTVALPVFAPVKQGADGDKDAYDKAPSSTGPYRVKPGSRTETQLTLVRNEYWNRQSDSVRKAYPDEIVIAADDKAPALTNTLIQDQGEARNTIMLNQDVAANFVQQVINDPALSARTAVGPMGAVRYFAINTRLIPDVRCRQVLELAFNKRKYRQAMGGSVTGELATSMIPPNLKANLPFDHYGTATNPDGDVETAEARLKEATAAKAACPTKIVVAHPANANIARFVKTLVDAYLRVGIQVDLRPVAPQGDLSYFDLISDPANPYHMVYAGWIPDWANGSAVIQPLFDGAVVPRDGEYGGSNYSHLQSPEIDKMIDDAMAENNLSRQYRLWGELDSKLQEMAVTVPVLYQNAIRLMGSNVTGAFIHSQFGMPDLCALGLHETAAPTAS